MLNTMGGEELLPGNYDEVEPPGTHFGAGTEQVSRFSCEAPGREI